MTVGLHSAKLHNHGIPGLITLACLHVQIATQKLQGLDLNYFRRVTPSKELCRCVTWTGILSKGRA